MKWNDNFAYAVGLFTADGCLCIEGRHLEFNSKDKEQVINFKKCLNLDNKITKKSRAGKKLKNIIVFSLATLSFINFLRR